MLYIIGILVCNDGGFVPQAALEAAQQDHEIQYAAAIIAGRVGLFKSPFGLDRYA
ncbi:hypothetical protein [Micromonospora sp. NPDC048898]|uniref:hypothetical protein n=1 Tax=Micromonospora sp. NPDC048898 TaxID=3364260 RepID=UPI0037213A54